MATKRKAQTRSVPSESVAPNRLEAQAAGDLQGTIDELSVKLQHRDDELAEAQIRLAEMERVVQLRDSSLSALNEEVQRLRAAVQQGSGASSASARVPKPDIHDVVDELPKHPVARYATRSLSRISHLCIHHSAASGSIPLENVARYHVEDRGWPGIGYHFYVKPDGAVYQTNRLETVSYHVSNNNDYTVGVCVSGDFTYAPPSDQQVDAASRLVAWLMQELSVPEQNVLGHKEFPQNDTSCPGETWLKKQTWKNTLLERTRVVRNSPVPPSPAQRIGHYVLFWQRPDGWAQQDWQAAEAYVGQFRPTAGFSLDDAMTARFVTIVGGPAGVSVEAEEQLRAAGCQVERLAGVDYADTKRILDSLAQSGQRFRSLSG